MIFMGKDEIRLKKTPLPDGYRCGNCKDYSFCSTLFNKHDDFGLFSNECRFDPCKFTAAKLYLKDCYFFRDVDPPYHGVLCSYDCRNEGEFNCNNCKYYLDKKIAHGVLKTYVNERNHNK